MRIQCPQKNCPQQLSCPCVKPANSTKCFSYDTTVQAVSIDEAIFSFPDFSDPSPMRSTMVQSSRSSGMVGGKGPGTTNNENSEKINDDSHEKIGIQAFAGPNFMTSTNWNSGGFSCNSADCAGCKYHVMEGFAKSLNTTINKSKRNENFRCPYLEQKEQEKQQITMSQNQQHDEIADQLINVLKKAGQKRRKRDINNNVLDGSVGGNVDGNVDGSVDGEISIDQKDLKDKLLGVSTTISCDYQRGQTLGEGSSWCGLCNICWTWRKLPPEYFPGYLNEVTCDTDNECLAGFGKCRPVLRTLTVLKNTARPGTSENWEQQSINTVAACECQVEAGTPLHSFITK